MKEKYNIVISERQAVPRSKRMREAGQAASSAAVFISGTGGGSSSGGSGYDAGLSRDIRVNSPQTGHIMPGRVLTKGMGYEQIFRKMLYMPTPATLVGKLSTPNDVEFGSTKGFITYTATRNDSGEMTKAYYDDNEENLLEFTGDAAGVQTATRQLTGIYTKGETYTATVVYGAGEDEEIAEMTLTNKISVNVKRKWFAGVCSSIPATSADVRALASSGLYNGPGSYKFSLDNWKMFAVCIPANTITNLTLTAYTGNFMENGVEGPINIMVEGANGSEPIQYKMWYAKAVMDNDPDTFTFKTA